MHNTIKRTLIVTGIILAGVPIVALAQWTSAPANPPSGNIAAPLNVGGANQIKTGGLEVGSLLSDGGAVIMGNLGIGTAVPGYKLQVGASGDGTSVGANAYYYISDRALKTNVSPLTGSLAKVLKLAGVSFNWKSNGESSVGVIAQDIEKVYPELVNIDQTTGYKSVEYGNLVAPLIEAIKEQQKQIDALKAEVEALKAAR